MSKAITKRTFTYSRVSTDYQYTENQTKYLDDWIKASGEKNIVRMSEIVSGRKMTGESLLTLWDAVQKDLVKRIVVYSIDRLGRNMRQALNLLHDCLEKDVDIIILNQPTLKLNSPEGRLMFSIMMSFAEFEACKISDRTKVGLERAKRRCDKCYHTTDDNLVDGVFKCVSCGHDLGRFRGFTKGTKWMSAKIALLAPEVLRLKDAGFNNQRIKEMMGIDERTVARIVNNRNSPSQVRERVWDQ